MKQELNHFRAIVLAGAGLIISTGPAISQYSDPGGAVAGHFFTFVSNPGNPSGTLTLKGRNRAGTTWQSYAPLYGYGARNAPGVRVGTMLYSLIAYSHPGNNQLGSQEIWKFGPIPADPLESAKPVGIIDRLPTNVTQGRAGGAVLDPAGTGASRSTSSAPGWKKCAVPPSEPASQLSVPYKGDFYFVGVDKKLYAYMSATDTYGVVDTPTPSLPPLSPVTPCRVGAGGTQTMSFYVIAAGTGNLLRIDLMSPTTIGALSSKGTTGSPNLCVGGAMGDKVFTVDQQQHNLWEYAAPGYAPYDHNASSKGVQFDNVPGARQDGDLFLKDIVGGSIWRLNYASGAWTLGAFFSPGVGNSAGAIAGEIVCPWNTSVSTSYIYYRDPLDNYWAVPVAGGLPLPLGKPPG